MALIVLEGPRAAVVAAAFKVEFGWPAWDLEPDIPETVRIDALSCRTPQEAIAYVEKCAFDPELHWLSPDGWNARLMAPVESEEGVVGEPI